MTEWKRICCAVDFGDPSRVAMTHAADLAKRLDAELLLLHVFAPPPAAASDVLVSSRGFANVDVEVHEETLERWRSDAHERSGRVTHARALQGAPGARIVELAREEGCDLIVVGTHGRSGVRRLVLGSVAEEVARHAHCPVLIVRDLGEWEKEELAGEIAKYR